MLRQRKMTLAIICFCIGAIAAMNTEGLVLALVFAVSGVLCAFFAAAHRFFSLNTRALAAYAACFMAGALYLAAYGMLVFDTAAKYDGKHDTVTAEVTEIQRYTDGEGVTLKIIASSAGVKYGTRVKFVTDKTPVYDTGDTVTAELNYYIGRSNSNRADFIFLCADGRVTESWDYGTFFVRLKQNIKQLIFDLHSNAPAEISRISTAVITGDGDVLDAHTYAVFRNSGVSHLLVVSGMHVSIISLALASVLKIFGAGLRPRIISSFALALVYGFFVGFTPSVIRTLIMLAFVTVDRLFMRHHDSINSLFVALMIIALANPYLLSSMSTLLSFGSCFAILLVSPYVETKLFGIKNYVLKNLVSFFITPLVFSAAVSLVTMPIMLFCGGTVCYISPLVNMLVTSFFGYVLIADVVSLILFSLTGWHFVGILPELCYKLIYNLLDLVYSLRIGSVSSSVPYFWVCVLFAAIFVLVISFAEGRRLKIGAVVSASVTAVSIVAVTLCFALSRGNMLTNEYIMGNSENAVFANSHGDVAYIDLGGKRSSGILPVQLGYDRIDDFVFAGKVSHERLAKIAGSIYIDRVHLPYDMGEEEYCEIYDLAQLFGFEICIYDDLSVVSCGETNVYISDSCIRTVTDTDDICYLLGEVGICSAETAVMTKYAKIVDDSEIICDIFVADDIYSGKNVMCDSFVNMAGYDSIKITLEPQKEVKCIEY